METNKHQLLNQSGCLSREAVLAWLDNRLSPAEMQIVDDHIKECILCREALEGFSHSDTSRTKTAFANLNYEMQQRLNQQEKKGLSRQLKLSLAAAVLVILAGIFSIFRFRTVEAPMQVAQETRQVLKEKTLAPLPEEIDTPQKNLTEKPQPASKLPEKKKLTGPEDEKIGNSVSEPMETAASQPEVLADVTERKEEPVAVAEENESLAYKATAAAKKSETPVMARSTRSQEKSIAVESGYNSETTFYVVENLPKFQGGELPVFKTYVENKVATAPEANQLKSGKMVVSFMVDKTGKVKDVFVAKGIDAKTDSLVKVIVHNSPVWSPGTQKGKAVNVSLVVEIVVK